MRDTEWARQAMTVQRRLFEAGKPCWLREFAPTLQSTPSGVGWWTKWWDEAGPDFRLRCADEISEGGKTTEVKWETIFLQEAEAWADAKWRSEVVGGAGNGGRRPGGNKLRTYALFKEKNELEPYLWRVQDASHRRLIAQLRMGVAPLRIELGRYERMVDGRIGLPAEER